jgi:hypothetical protein
MRGQIVTRICTNKASAVPLLAFQMSDVPALLIKHAVCSRTMRRHVDTA